MRRMRLEHRDRPAMRERLAELPTGTPVAMEGSFGWQWIADLLEELDLDPHLSHPPAIKVLAKNEAKADRVDADRLGRFWLRGIFPESYLATPDVRQLRERLRYRMALVGVQTGRKSRIQARNAPPRHPARLQRPVRQRRPGVSAAAHSAGGTSRWPATTRCGGPSPPAGWSREICELFYVIWMKGEPYREPTPIEPRRQRRPA